MLATLRKGRKLCIKRIFYINSHDGETKALHKCNEETNFILTYVLYILK